MKPSESLNFHRDTIRQVVLQHHACNPRIFGSVIHGLDTEESDLDLLIDPKPQTTLLDIAKITVELEALLGISVDVLTPKALPEKFREQVLAEAVSI